MSERQPPLAQNLNAVPAGYSWQLSAVPGRAVAEGAVPDSTEADQLRAQVRRLTVALEDIVTFALSSADYKERAIMMHRRAVAALSAPHHEADRPEK